MLTENLLNSARELGEGIISLRRAIHAEPELGLHTPKTMAKVREALADLPKLQKLGAYAVKLQGVAITPCG